MLPSGFLKNTSSSPIFKEKYVALSVKVFPVLTCVPVVKLVPASEFNFAASVVASAFARSKAVAVGPGTHRAKTKAATARADLIPNADDYRSNKLLTQLIRTVIIKRWAADRFRMSHEKSDGPSYARKK